ncbi:HpcH/HpaI aldolase/citrate lyase family protein, partial [Bacillus pumilus]|uniref:HpcH/HpaI aldolase/citrate lyase family protein n=1 Tax=Bacillus pumilus TaxID=1408 RepID=UPI0037048C1B
MHANTLIHPTHLNPLQTIYLLTNQHYIHPLTILQHPHPTLPLINTTFSNKINQTNPHYRSPDHILINSHIYPLFHQNTTYIHILTQPQPPYPQHLPTYPTSP